MQRNIVNRSVSYEVQPYMDAYAGYAVVHETVTHVRTGKQDRSLVSCIRVTPIVNSPALALDLLGDVKQMVFDTVQ